jgi:hypothetical protein
MERKREDGRLADSLTQTLPNNFVTLQHKSFVVFKLLIRAISRMLRYHQWVSHGRFMLPVVRDKCPKLEAASRSGVGADLTIVPDEKICDKGHYQI